MTEGSDKRLKESWVEATSLGLKTKLGLRPNCQSTRVYIQMRSNGSQGSQNNRVTYSKVHHELAMSWQSKYSSIISWRSIDSVS